tara:strand:+ start:212 stop:508 length:297 start_codon:yes stop_codon:yes gene_type:complete
MLQKIVNGIAIASGVVSLAVVGTVGYVYVRKDAIIEDIKGKVMESVMPNIGGGIMNSIPKFTGPAGPPMDPSADAPASGPNIPSSPIPEGTGLGIPPF